jgi:hypothetical protein
MSDTPTLFDVAPIPAPTYRTCPCCRGAGMVLDLDEPIPSAPARNTDPDTSHKAAARHKDGDIRRFTSKSIKARLLQVIADHGPMTHQAAALALVPLAPGNTSRFRGAETRVSELGRCGFIADTGRRVHNPGSNCEAILWEVTGRGWEALDHLDKIGRSIP